MNPGFVDEVKRYLRFTDEDSRVLVALRPLLEANARPLIDEFYERILEHPRASAAITGGREQIERLKATLRAWLVELADERHGTDYALRRAAIGRRHVVIALPQVFMVTGMHVVRRRLTASIRSELGHDPGQRERALAAVHKVLDLDLAIMLEAYHEDLLARELDDARAQLEEKRRLAALGEMVAGIAHEIRNPLQHVAWGIADLKAQDGALDGRAGSTQDALEKIARGTREIEAIVAEVLDFARPMRLDRAPFPVRELLDDSRDAVLPAAQAAGVAVEVEPGQAFEASLDGLKLKQALVNVARNAIEASPPGGRVLLRATRADGAVAFEVEDEGPGVPPGLQERIFLPFVTTKVKGTGLGLAVVRRVVEAHQGTIRLDPRTPRGTIARIALPGA